MRHSALHIACIFALLSTTQLLWGQTDISYPIDTINGKTYYRYTVERSVGLYRISVNFGVKQEEILQANPVLQKRGVHYGEVILIPIKEAANLQPSNHSEDKQKNELPTQPSEQQILVEWDHAVDTLTITPSPVDSLTHIAIVDTLLTDSLTIDTIQLDSTAIRLAMLLPLQVEAIKRDKNMDRFYDFYAGALIAIYQAQARGTQIEVFTYDIGRTTSELQNICQQPDIHSVDAIIGPAYAQQVAMLVDSTAKDSIWTLIPFLSKVEQITQQPYLLKFNPSVHIEADTLARYLAQRSDSINCVLVESKEGDIIPAGIEALHQALLQYQVPQSSISIHALLNDSIDYAFKPDVENIIIFNTEKYANLQAVMPHLLKIAANYPITLFSQYSWQNEKIALPQLFTSVFTNQPIATEEYEALYHQYFKHELASTHPRYDLLGYDLTSHLIQMLIEMKASNTTDVLNTLQWQGTQANIHYRPVGTNGGWENHVIHIIHQ